MLYVIPLESYLYFYTRRLYTELMYNLTKINLMEIWKDILGYEGIYLISSEGNVKSIKRHGTRGVEIKLSKNTSGRLRMTLHKDNTAKEKQIHRLVAETFLKNPENKPCVCHKNGIPTDNRVDNLYWGTYRENESDKKIHGTCARGETQGGHKLTEKDVLEIRKLYETKRYSQVALGLMFKTRQTNISLIVRRLAWKHI